LETGNIFKYVAWNIFDRLSNQLYTTCRQCTPLTRGEIYVYLSDNTQINEDGGIYYSGAGTLETIVDGEKATGEWSTYEGGKLCRHIEGIEGESCEVYYHNNDEISIEVDGVAQNAPKIMAGNAVIVKEMFTTEEAVSLVSGNTVVWPPNGGVYYDPDGKLLTLWDGVKEGGKWEVTDDGEVCWKVLSWGSTPCESYYQSADGLRVIYQGKDSEADEFREGDVLNSL
jgi:hypothetical protein